MLEFDIDIKGLEAQLEQVVTKAQKAARLGARAGAKVYYDAVREAAPVSEKGHWFHGTSFKAQTGRKFKDGSPRPDWAGGTKYWFESGSLKGAVYQYFQRDGDLNNPTYHVAWNHRAVPYGFMVAAGTSRGVKGNDFLGNARKSAQARAVEAMLAEFDRAMQ